MFPLKNLARKELSMSFVIQRTNMCFIDRIHVLNLLLRFEKFGKKNVNTMVADAIAPSGPFY